MEEAASATSVCLGKVRLLVQACNTWASESLSPSIRPRHSANAESNLAPPETKNKPDRHHLSCSLVPCEQKNTSWRGDQILERSGLHDYSHDIGAGLLGPNSKATAREETQKAEQQSCPSYEQLGTGTAVMSSPKMEKTIYIGAFVHCKTLTELDICECGMIGVDEDGKIAFVLRDVLEGGQFPASRPQGWEQSKIVRLEGNQFFFPGFIGVFGKSTLLDWLNTYTFPLESSFSDLATASRIYNRVVARTLSHGTTTAAYYATIHVPATNLLADICQARGQRAFVGRVCMDRLSPDFYCDASAAKSLEDTQACIAHIRRIDPAFELISPILTPRFALSCSHESMCALARLHRDTGLPIQTHISENTAECALVAQTFPHCASYTHVYDAAGLLTPRTILAHAVHLSADERALMRRRGAKISHCPASNTALTSGTAKVRTLLNDGLTVGLGTDVSGGYTSSVLAEAREAIFVSRHVAMAEGDKAKLSVEEALYLATRGGAKVVGLEARIGGFEAGMDWDAQAVDLHRVDHATAWDESAGLVEIFGGESWEEKVAKWVFTGDDRNTAAVWVKGRLVHRRGGFGHSI